MTNALEEAYRFVASRYDNTARLGGKVRSPAMKAAALFDSGRVSLPEHYAHFVAHLAKVFDRCQQEHREVDTQLSCKRGAPSYGLHLLRTIRNHVAHGVFPLIGNPEYEGEANRTVLIQLLNGSSRVGTFCIQALLGTFNDGFKSHEYDAISGGSMALNFNDLSSAVLQTMR